MSDRTTVDEARAALLVSFVGNATDSPIARALEPRIDALIAAVRAETSAKWMECARKNGELGIALVEAEERLAEAAQELAALRHHIVQASIYMTQGHWTDAHAELGAALAARAAATPGEDGEGRT